MRKVIFSGFCILLCLLFALPATVNSQTRAESQVDDWPESLSYRSRLHFKKVPGLRSDRSLIDFGGAANASAKYRDFVNLVQQLEMKQRELDQAVVRIFLATHGHFKNDPKRNYYETANVNMGLRKFEEASKEMVQILNSMQTLLRGSRPSSRTATKSKSQSQAYQIVREVGCYLTPFCGIATGAADTIEKTAAGQTADIVTLYVDRVNFFLNEIVSEWYLHDAGSWQEGCWYEMQEICDEVGLACDNLAANNSGHYVGFKRDLFFRLSGDTGWRGTGFGCLSNNCNSFWQGAIHFKDKGWTPNTGSGSLGSFDCASDDCSVTGVLDFVRGKAAPFAVEFAENLALMGTWHAILGTINYYKPRIGKTIKRGLVTLNLSKIVQNNSRKVSFSRTASKAAIILAVDANGQYILYSVPILGDKVAFDLPVGTYSGMIVSADHYAVAFEDLEIKHNQEVETNTESCTDCGDIDFIPYLTNTDYVYDCDGHCPTCAACVQHQWIGKFEGSLETRQPCGDGGGMFTIKGDFDVDFILEDIKEEDLPGGPVQDPEAYHFMNVPGAQAKVKWKNFTHRTCPKGCVIRFAKTPPSFEFWTAWDWEVQNDDFVGINLRFQNLKEATPVYCGPDKMSDFNIYSAGIMALPMKDPDKYVPRTGDVIQRTWKESQGPVKMELKMRLEKKKKVP